MDKEIFKQFEEQFGSEWVCSCGSSFESSWVEVISQTQNSLVAKYLCQVCGKEQMFAVSADFEEKLHEPLIKVPSDTITSDDILDIKAELAEASLPQIRSLSRKKSKAKISITKVRP